MMNCVENMRRVLSESGAYKLDGESMVDKELEAYGAGLGLVEESALRLEQDMFAMTAGEEQLAAWEMLYRRQASWAELDVRRRGVAKALSLMGGPVTAGDMAGFLDAAGISGSARVEGGKVVVHVDGYLGVTEAEAKRVLGRLMPLQVKWEIEAEA